MDQIKTGKLIANMRKEKGLTQAELGELLGITDRAVSKWERGISMPDSGIMLDLCRILGISVEDLLTGEVIEMKDNQRHDELLIEIVKQKEESDRYLLILEIVIGVLSTVILFAAVFTAAFVTMQDWIRVTLIVVGFVIAMIGFSFAIRIEQIAGYYECGKCHHKYIPKYSSVFAAMHMGRTRYMKCPKCGKHSWNHKVISKD